MTGWVGSLVGMFNPEVKLSLNPQPCPGNVGLGLCFVILLICWGIMHFRKALWVCDVGGAWMGMAMYTLSVSKMMYIMIVIICMLSKSI